MANKKMKHNGKYYEMSHYGGEGFGFSKEDGVYEVKWSTPIKKIDKVKKFTKLSEARKFYSGIKTTTSKAIWGINPIPELLDCHTYKLVEDPKS